LLDKYSGRVPQTFEELEALPGVGHKTASVVMVHAFKKPAFPVDTHIHRLAARWSLSDGSSVERTERDLKSLFPERDWERLHLQLIYFGRQHCPALRHDLAQCPICSWAAPKVRHEREKSAGSGKNLRSPARKPRAR
jgi:endonuclease-3